MGDIDERSLALIRAPVGCALLFWIERLDMSPETASEPVMTFGLVGRAPDGISIWQGQYDAMVQELLLADPRL